MRTYILCIWLCYAGTAIAQQQELLVNGPEFASLAGYDVAIHGEYAVVGAPFHGGFGSNNAGAAFVFQLQDGTWNFTKKLLPPWGGTKGDDFGISVDISEDRIIVGARHVDHDDKDRVGAAYVFLRTEDDWYLESKLFPEDGAPEDGFGRSVGISGNKAIVGAAGNDAKGAGAGAAYLYQTKSATWSLIGKLHGSDTRDGDNFGAAVAMDGELVIAGAPGNEGVDDKESGAAYVFDCSGPSTEQVARLTPRDADVLDHFGKAVDIDDGEIIVGAPFANEKIGKAYIFIQNGSRFAQQAILEPEDGLPFDKFGHAVAITFGRALVGTLTEKAHLFARSGSTWSQEDMLMADDGQAGDQFAHAVDIDGPYTIVGAPHHSHTVAKEGAAYINGPLPDLSDCPFDLTLSDNIQPAEHHVLDHITVEGTLLQGALSLHSGNYVLFNSEFTLNTGSELLVEMDGCR